MPLLTLPIIKHEVDKQIEAERGSGKPRYYSTKAMGTLEVLPRSTEIVFSEFESVAVL